MNCGTNAKVKRLEIEGSHVHRDIVVVDDAFCDLEDGLRALGLGVHVPITFDALDDVALRDDDYNPIVGDITVQVGEETLRILATTSPKRALAHVTANTALLISDYMMPGMDGIAVAQAARLKAPQLPVIIRTGTPEIAATRTAAMENIRLVAKRSGALADLVRETLRK